MSTWSSSVSEEHFKNAVHPAVSTDLKHPYHSYVNIQPPAPRMNLAGVRARPGSAEHHTSQAQDLPGSRHGPAGRSSPERWSGTRTVLVSASWCHSSNGHLTHGHFGNWQSLSNVSWIQVPLLFSEKNTYFCKGIVNSFKNSTLRIPNIC